MEELLIKVDVQGEVDINNVNKGIDKVGKTANKTQSEIAKLRKEIKDAKNVMLTAEEGSVKYNDALRKVADSQFKLKDINDKSRAAVQDFGQTAKNIGGVVSGLAGGFSVVTGAMALFGAENDAVAKALLKVQSAMAIASGFGQFADSIDSMKDLFAGLKASAAASKGVISEISDVTTSAADGMSNLGKETAVVSSNLAGGLGTANAINDSNKALLGQIELLNKHNDILDEDLFKINERKEAIIEEARTTGVLTKEHLGEIDQLNEKLRENSINYVENNSKISNLNNSTNDAAKVTEKQSSSVLKQIGTMGLWVAAITAVIIAISYLIEKLNEIPKDLELKIKLDEQALKDTEKARIKVSEIKHDLDIISGKNDKISLNQLKNIKAVMVEQGIANEKDIKNLSAKEIRESKYFQDYLEKVRQTSKEEALIKLKTEAEIKGEVAKQEQNTILEEVRKKFLNLPDYLKNDPRFKEYLANKNKEADKFIEDWKAGRTGVLGANYSGLLNIWNDTVEKQKQANKELSLYSKMYKDIQSNQNKSGKNQFLIEPPKNQKTEVKRNEGEKPTYLPSNMNVETSQQKKAREEALAYAKVNAIIHKEGVAGAKAEYDLTVKSGDDIVGATKTYLNKLSELRDEENGKKIDKTKTDFEDELYVIQSEYDHQLISYDEFLQAKLSLLKKYGLNSDKTQKEINSREIEGIRQTISALGDLSSGISDLYQSQIDMNDSKYEAEKENIENTVTNEATKNAKLKQLDAQYNKTQEKLFEQQKQAKLATAWMDFASGVIGIWSKDMSSLPTPYSQIIAGIETAALLATTVAQTRSIEAQRYNKASSASSSSPSSSSSSTSVALTPNQTALTSSEDRLNTNVSNSSNVPQQVVKVSDINKVQNTVSVRENNSQY